VNDLWGDRVLIPEELCPKQMKFDYVQVHPSQQV
jgi:hypothetical protein